jgi:hypothetical protein
MAVADGDLVMVNGRYTGWGAKPMVAVDIFRVKDGKVVEHWDVMQEEVSAADLRLTKSIRFLRGRIQGMLDLYNVFNNRAPRLLTQPTDPRG